MAKLECNRFSQSVYVGCRSTLLFEIWLQYSADTVQATLCYSRVALYHNLWPDRASAWAVPGFAIPLYMCIHAKIISVGSVYLCSCAYVVPYISCHLCIDTYCMIFHFEFIQMDEQNQTFSPVNRINDSNAP